MERTRLPTAWTVKEGTGEVPRARPGARTLRGAVERGKVRARAAGSVFLTYFFGLLPLFLAMLLALGLVWGSALAASP